MLEHDPRLTLIRTWLTRDLGWRVGRISVASADASFRRYFRVSRGDVDPAGWAPKADTLIVMDAPPGKEDIAPYLKVSTLLEQAGAHVPHVHASDARRGFVVMEDLGNTQYLSLLKTGRGVDKLYGDALTTLANIQVRGLRAAQQLAPYDREPLERELNLMPEWFLGKHLGLELTPEERALITVTFEFLINEATAAAAGVRAPRLSLAQPHGAAPFFDGQGRAGRHRLPGRAARTRSATTSCRCSRIATSAGRASASSAG